MEYPINVTHKEIPDYSKVYPTAWKEGFKKGRKRYNDGFDLTGVSTKSRFKDFWKRMAYCNGIADGYNTEQELFYEAIL